jgi:acyl-CoA thioesterase-1
MKKFVSRRATALVALLFLFSCTSPGSSRYGPVTYVAIGASDTVGVGATDPDKDAWVAKVFAQLPAGSTFVRLGVSGSTAEQAVQAQLPTAEKANGDLVTVWLAVNDFNSLMPLDRYKLALDKIIKGTSSHGERVFVGNVPDLSKLPAYSSVPPAILVRRIEQWNDAIEEVVDRDHAVLVDLVEPSRRLAKEGKSLISEDGFHPSSDGYLLLADTFWEAIKDDSQIGPRVSR